MKASQALSREIEVDRLLSRLMEAALEQAGAQAGLLLLRKGDAWHIEAQQSQHRQPTTMGQAILPDQSNPQSLPLSMSLVRYVERSGGSVMIHEAASNELTAADPYVRRHNPRSLLMVPVVNQETLMGMLYLENNAASGAFSRARLQVIELLASQAAISIENARLYADMERKAATHATEAQSMY
jgi:GAF domain-containing protein